MIKETVSIDHVIELLNEALALDPVAISTLVTGRALCNEALAKHPTIQVAAAGPAEGHKVGLLGVLNGLFGCDERQYGAICAVYDTTPTSPNLVLIKFMRTPHTGKVLFRHTE